MMADIEYLESKLLEMYSHRGDGILTQYVIPVGPDAFALITSLRAEVAILEAELKRRDANETRNCLNWGPCSRHDGRMAELREGLAADRARCFAYIREQAARDDVVEAGTDCGPIGCCSLQPQEVQDIFTEMLNVIERTCYAS
jgi:hypothetical protein